MGESRLELHRAIAMISKVLVRIKQRLYPKEFRITLTDIHHLLNDFEQICSLVVKPATVVDQKTDKQGVTTDLITDLGVIIWRIHKRLASYGKIPDELKRISRDVESVLDVLRQSGIEIKDHTGDRYDGGMALRVITFEPTDDIVREQVIETIKPTIYYNGRLLKMGEVIVGVPKNKS